MNIDYLKRDFGRYHTRILIFIAVMKWIAATNPDGYPGSENGYPGNILENANQILTSLNEQENSKDNEGEWPMNDYDDGEWPMEAHDDGEWPVDAHDDGEGQLMEDDDEATYNEGQLMEDGELPMEDDENPQSSSQNLPKSRAPRNQKLQNPNSQLKESMICSECYKKFKNKRDLKLIEYKNDPKSKKKFEILFNYLNRFVQNHSIYKLAEKGKIDKAIKTLFETINQEPEFSVIYNMPFEENAEICFFKYHLREIRATIGSHCAGVLRKFTLLYKNICKALLPSDAAIMKKVKRAKNKNLAGELSDKSRGTSKRMRRRIKTRRMTFTVDEISGVIAGAGGMNGFNGASSSGTNCVNRFNDASPSGTNDIVSDYWSVDGIKKVKHASFYELYREFLEKLFTDEKDPVINEKDPVINERDPITIGRDSITNGRDPITNGRDSITNGRDPLLKDRILLLKDRNSSLSDKDSPLSDEDLINYLKDFCSAIRYRGKNNVTQIEQQFYDTILLKIFRTREMTDEIISMALDPYGYEMFKTMNIESLCFLANYTPRAVVEAEAIKLQKRIDRAIILVISNGQMINSESIFNLFRLYKACNRLPMGVLTDFVISVSNKILKMPENTHPVLFKLHYQLAADPIFNSYKGSDNHTGSYHTSGSHNASNHTSGSHNASNHNNNPNASNHSNNSYLCSEILICFSELKNNCPHLFPLIDDKENEDIELLLAKQNANDLILEIVGELYNFGRIDVLEEFLSKIARSLSYESRIELLAMVTGNKNLSVGNGRGLAFSTKVCLLYELANCGVLSRDIHETVLESVMHSPCLTIGYSLSLLLLTVKIRNSNPEQARAYYELYGNVLESCSAILKYDCTRHSLDCNSESRGMFYLIHAYDMLFKADSNLDSIENDLAVYNFDFYKTLWRHLGLLNGISASSPCYEGLYEIKLSIFKILHVFFNEEHDAHSSYEAVTDLIAAGIAPGDVYSRFLLMDSELDLGFLPSKFEYKRHILIEYFMFYSQLRGDLGGMNIYDRSEEERRVADYVYNKLAIFRKMMKSSFVEFQVRNFVYEACDTIYRWNIAAVKDKIDEKILVESLILTIAESVAEKLKDRQGDSSDEMHSITSLCYLLSMDDVMAKSNRAAKVTDGIWTKNRRARKSDDEVANETIVLSDDEVITLSDDGDGDFEG